MITDRVVRRYVIVGAGAVGCAAGGLLQATGARVLFVARPNIAAAIKKGLVIKHPERETRISGDAITSVDQIKPEPGDAVLIAVKSQHTEEVVDGLSKIYSTQTPIVCLQNATCNEEIAARKFQRVYAGLVLLTAVQLDPSVITIPQGNTFVIGCYPSGLDQVAEQIRDDLARAGFDAIASPHVMAMKWGKLIANLNNATHAITGYWLERSMADPEMRALMVAVREEGLRVLAAAGIAPEPPEGEKSPIRIRKATEEMKQPPKGSLEEAANLPEEKRTYPSMLQDLALGRRSHEAEALNGEIIRLGEQAGIATPYNRSLLETMNRMTTERLKPGVYTPSQLHAMIRQRMSAGE